MNFVINQSHNRKKKYALLSFFYQIRSFAVENSNMAYKYSNFAYWRDCVQELLILLKRGSEGRLLLCYNEELSALSVGNGNFAVTVDATGLQTFPDFYAKGVPLGTQAQWGWHSFPNPEDFRFEETLKDYDFRGKPEPYSVQFGEPGRSKDAANWFRVNPHRLHLGYVGFEAEGLRPSDIQYPHQELDLWNGTIHSRFVLNGD